MHGQRHGRCVCCVQPHSLEPADFAEDLRELYPGDGETPEFLTLDSNNPTIFGLCLPGSCSPSACCGSDLCFCLSLYGLAVTGEQHLYILMNCSLVRDGWINRTLNLF